ncbi:MAG: surface-adhesin E family protein [Syntrophaceae bacterium]
MRTVSAVISISLLIILLLVNPVIGSSDWEEYWRFQGDIYSYNKDNIKHRTKNIVQVWSKVVYSDKGREKLIQIMRNRGMSTEGYDKLAHSIDLSEIDCKKKMCQLLSVTHYDTDGSVLYSGSSDKPRWKYIVPDSIFDPLRKIVCNNQ